MQFCPNCGKEIPILARMHEDGKPKDREIIFVECPSCFARTGMFSMGKGDGKTKAKFNDFATKLPDTSFRENVIAGPMPLGGGGVINGGQNVIGGQSA